jgi:hypothetical protein
MTKKYWMATFLASSTLFPQTTSAQVMLSTYSETLSCPVTEEGEDAFTRECEGPGNVKAVLQYVDGLFGVFYLPMNGKVPMERSDMVEVSPNARHPYGAKHEWRIRKGDGQPCAAIIRAYATKGEFLVVTDLEDGKRLGRVKTNQQAVNLADKACANSSKVNGSSEVVTAPITPFPSDDTITQSANKGTETFSRIYTETGISGAMEEIERCYQTFDRQPSVAGLANCAALDIVAANVDTAMTRNVPNLGQAFFSGEKPDQRIIDGMNRLGLDDQQRAAFDKEISTALGVALTIGTSDPAEKVAPKSVFSF